MRGRPAADPLAATHVLSPTFFPSWLRRMEADAPAPTTVQLTANNMVVCERLMPAGHAQFLLSHDHPAATTRLTKNAFRSVRLGRGVLLPVAAPGRAKVTRSPGPPVFAYTSASGTGRTFGADPRRRLDCWTSSPRGSSGLGAAASA